MEKYQAFFMRFPLAERFSIQPVPALIDAFSEVISFHGLNVNPHTSVKVHGADLPQAVGHFLMVFLCWNIVAKQSANRFGIHEPEPSNGSSLKFIIGNGIFV